MLMGMTAPHGVEDQVDPIYRGEVDSQTDFDPRTQTPSNDTAVEWTAVEARSLVRVPGSDDDKYSRGVLGVRTGSAAYPGAAVLGVEAAVRTGLGMLRYLGADEPTRLVLQRRPEVVTAPGRVQAWLLGSGMDASARTSGETAALRAAVDEDVPRVLDAGALDLVVDAGQDTIITPHAGELATLWQRVGMRVERSQIAGAPLLWARRTAERFGVTVLLKGSRTIIATAETPSLCVTASSSWAATAGSGDVLGGILGALLATTAERESPRPSELLSRVAATAAFVHQAAANRASNGGPIAALDIAEAVPHVIADLLRH
jgi:NAD(P)H-hydrate repair Nnr-like enzyme with NAD(P)H-hydrate dehydratase domain